jgi:2,4-dienoyl-CoA reductase-like NADH-dependent reductase (Old Yellow Enzyme family)
MNTKNTSILFKPFELAGIRLDNRFVRSATMENLAAEDRTPSSNLISLYEDLAQGGVGLIITSAVRADRTWDPHAGGKGLCLDRDDLIPSFKEMVERVHQAGSRIAVQLGSFFRYKNTMVIPYAETVDDSKHMLTIEDIHRIVECFGEAGARSRKAGFDAIQINAAHAFPLSQFLSPCYNRRQDEYGGSTKNRARFLSEIVAKIKQRAGDDFPVFVKMNVADFCDGGIDVEEAVRIVDVISTGGIAAVEASGGGIGHYMTWLGPAKKKEWKEGYLRPYAAELKSKISIPLIMVGGLRNYTMAEEIIENAEADLISMSRPLIREPGLIKRWENGDRRATDCVSCNGCMGRFKENRQVECANLYLNLA